MPEQLGAIIRVARWEWPPAGGLLSTTNTDGQRSESGPSGWAMKCACWPSNRKLIACCTEAAQLVRCICCRSSRSSCDGVAASFMPLETAASAGGASARLAAWAWAAVNGLKTTADQTIAAATARQAHLKLFGRVIVS